MNEATLLLRQIHPSFVQDKRPSSQAFRPTRSTFLPIARAQPKRRPSCSKLRLKVVVGSIRMMQHE